MVVVPTILLNNGLQCPQLGLGTWQSAPGEVQKAISHAIDIGYRHIDCAWLYGNEKEVGEAIRAKIKDKTVKREDLFIVTKLWNTFHEKNQVVPACKVSLQDLGLDYVDLYLVHWPVAQKYEEGNATGGECIDVDYLETWKGMEECTKLGLSRSIGVSNFNTKQLQRVLDHATIKPVMNQIEVSPNLTQKTLISFCNSHDVAVTAYCPFGSPARPWAKPEDQVVSLKDSRIINIGAKYGKNSPQVILRYLVQVGVIPIPKSSNLKRLEENLNIFDFELSQDDIATLDGLNTNGRAVPADHMRSSPYFPFDEE